MITTSHRFAVFSFFVVVSYIAASTSFARAAIESREVLKTYFETGDIPTEQQFSNLIDSMVNLPSDGGSVSGVGADDLGLGALLKEGVEVGPGLLYSDVAGLGEAWVGQSGYLGLRLEIDSQPHYGYLQITAAPNDQYPMFVEYLVYETDPNTPISTVNVPEPSTLVLSALGLLAFVGVGWWKRR